VFPADRNVAPVALDPVTAASAEPVALRLPGRVGAEPIVPQGLDEDGALTVPADGELVGWWSGGVRPGEVGPAVLVGHVATSEGPAVFAGLHELEPGDLLDVHQRGGGTITFEVTRLQQVEKARFPFEDVYGPTGGAELRLVTCGGPVDPTTGWYLHNVIVHAVALDVSGRDAVRAEAG
jgi:hypothetical protein